MAGSCRLPTSSPGATNHWLLTTVAAGLSPKMLAATKTSFISSLETMLPVNKEASKSVPAITEELSLPLHLLTVDVRRLLPKSFSTSAISFLSQHWTLFLSLDPSLPPSLSAWDQTQDPVHAKPVLFH